MTSRADVDVLVVGGSVAGSATAVGLAQAGLHVTVLDRQAFPREKPCGEGIMPRGARALDELGVTPQLLAGGARALRGVVYHQGKQQAHGEFPGGQQGLCVRRLVLDSVMGNLCKQHGVQRLEDARASELESTPQGWCVRTAQGQEFNARFLVGADGRGSWVRRQLNLDAPRSGKHRYGVRQHFRVRQPLPEGLVHVHLCGTHEVYITPEADGCTNVALLLGKDGSTRLGGDLQAAFLSILRTVPDVAALLDGAEPLSEVLACGPLRVDTRGPVTRGALLVGDASGYLDAITGEGVSLALAQARAAVPVIVGAVREGRPLDAYVAAHRELVRDHIRMTQLVLFAAARPWLMGRMVKALGRRPDLFGRLLGLNDGVESFPSAMLGVGPGLLGAALG
jgi:flavin-dependent dehydrogenase